ncbi:unnamed protein product, partial [Iphiclides podalirius]
MSTEREAEPQLTEQLTYRSVSRVAKLAALLEDRRDGLPAPPGPRCPLGQQRVHLTVTWDQRRVDIAAKIAYEATTCTYSDYRSKSLLSPLRLGQLSRLGGSFR